MGTFPKGIKAGRVSDALIDVTDMAATFLDVSGAKPVVGAILDGMSIAPLWRGEKDSLKTSILTEMGFSKAVVTDDFKYIAIRYDDKTLARGFVPPKSGSLKDHLEKGAFKLLWKKTPFGQPTKTIGMADPDQLFIQNR